jgi:predicted nucleotidyltransferase
MLRHRSPPDEDAMTLRALPSDFAPRTIAAIDAALADIEAEHGASILLAIESGSRAWGFPSPDSDYDCRFVFVRPVAHYLSPWSRRDVIELPLDAELDVNGWDLGKALKLLLKGNAVIIEWLRSPIVYRGDAGLRDALLAFATRFADRDLIGRHYLHLGERQRRTHFGDGSAVAQKKIFYALRPAATLRWLRLHPDQAVAPMHFPTLMAECDPPQAVTRLVDDLLVRKAVTRELGTEPLPPAIAAFIDGEFELARPLCEGKAFPPTDEAREAAEALFRGVAMRWDRSSAWPGSGPG